MQQGCKNGFFVGKMVMWSRVQVEICVGGFSVVFTAHGALRSPTDVNVKKSHSLSPWRVKPQTSADLYFAAEAQCSYAWMAILSVATTFHLNLNMIFLLALCNKELRYFCRSPSVCRTEKSRMEFASRLELTPPECGSSTPETSVFTRRQGLTSDKAWMWS